MEFKAKISYVGGKNILKLINTQDVHTPDLASNQANPDSITAHIVAQYR